MAEVVVFSRDVVGEQNRIEGAVHEEVTGSQKVSLSLYSDNKNINLSLAFKF